MTRLRDHGLSLVLFSLFALTLVGQSVAGFHEYNEDQQAHGESTATYASYLTTPHFGEAVFENWESEFLQMAAYVLLTIFFVQRGSAESKDPDADEDTDAQIAAHRDDPNAPWPVRRGGWVLSVYKYSLPLALLLLFAGSMLGHAVAGLGEYNAERTAHGETPAALGDYVRSAQFWFESLQNWQSEFLAVFAIVVLSIWLRADGSPESKPVWKPHRDTGNA